MLNPWHVTMWFVLNIIQCSILLQPQTQVTKDPTLQVCQSGENHQCLPEKKTRKTLSKGKWKVHYHFSMYQHFMAWQFDIMLCSPVQYNSSVFVILSLFNTSILGGCLANLKVIIMQLGLYHKYTRYTEVVYIVVLHKKYSYSFLWGLVLKSSLSGSWAHSRLNILIIFVHGLNNTGRSR